MKRLLALMLALFVTILTVQHAFSISDTDDKTLKEIQAKLVPQPNQPVALAGQQVRPRQSTGGTVTQIGPDSISVAFHATGGTVVKVGPDGRPVSFTNRFIPATPPMSFKFTQSLIDGKPDKWFGDDFSYRITDVQVGGHVMIGRSSLNGVDYCHQICIYRRPGGKIPPAPDDKKGKYLNRQYMWHEFHQAWQDFEEKGVPIPDRFPDPNRTTISMPREVKNPRIPDAEP